MSGLGVITSLRDRRAEFEYAGDHPAFFRSSPPSFSETSRRSLISSLEMNGPFLRDPRAEKPDERSADPVKDSMSGWSTIEPVYLCKARQPAPACSAFFIAIVFGVISPEYKYTKDHDPCEMPTDTPLIPNPIFHVFDDHGCGKRGRGYIDDGVPDEDHAEHPAGILTEPLKRLCAFNFLFGEMPDL